MVNLSKFVRAYKQAGAFNSLLAPHRFIDEHVFLTKSNQLGVVLDVEGIDYECLTESTIESYSKRAAAAWRSFDERFRIYQYVVKRDRAPLEHADHTNPAVQKTVADRTKYLKSKATGLYTVRLVYVILFGVPTYLNNGSNPAIVTGLLGVDGVHNGGYTELHPVYSMAIHILKDDYTDEHQAGGLRLVEHWVFFIRNYGNEENCSQMEHYYGEGSGAFYYIQIPWENNVPNTDFSGHGNTSIAATGVSAKGTAWLWMGGEAFKMEADAGRWIYLDFQLSDSSGADGEAWLTYSFPPGSNPYIPASRTSAISPIKPSQNVHASEKEVNWQNFFSQVTDPAVKARLQQALPARPQVQAQGAQAVTVQPEQVTV